MKNKRILVVDDCESIREAAKILLEQEGFDISLANDGVEAINILAKDSAFGMVITDGRMPNKIGVEVIKYVKSSCPQIKTIFFSSDDGIEALLAGADAAVLKDKTAFPQLVEMVKKFTLL